MTYFVKTDAQADLQKTARLTTVPFLLCTHIPPAYDEKPGIPKICFPFTENDLTMRLAEIIPDGTIRLFHTRNNRLL